MPTITPSNSLIDTIRFGASLVSARLTVYNTSGQPVSVEYVPVSTMSITVDRNSAQRRSGTINVEAVPSVPPPPFLPISPASILAPFGNEIYIETGIATIPAGVATPTPVVQQWIPMGLFSIATSTVSDTGVNCVVSLSVYDRSWVISQRKLKKPYIFPATPSGEFAEEVETLLNQVWDNGANPLQYNIVPTSATVPQASYNQGSDPWQAALDMANAVGYELFFDANGVVTARPIPDPSTQPATWNFTDDETAIYGDGGSGSGGSTVLFGSPYSTPVDVAVTMTRDGIYNDVIVTGTGTSNAPYSNTGTSQPVLASAADTNPNSATYVNGGMGDVPEFVSTNLATTSGQAQEIADNDLQAALSSAWQITISFPPGAVFIDVDDVVGITRPRIGLNNVYVVVDTLDYQISYGSVCKLTGRVVPR